MKKIRNLGFTNIDDFFILRISLL